MSCTQLSFPTFFLSVIINHFIDSGRALERNTCISSSRRAAPICFLSFRDRYPSLPESQCLQNRCFTHFAVIVCVCICLRNQAKICPCYFHLTQKRHSSASVPLPCWWDNQSVQRVGDFERLPRPQSKSTP